MPLRNKTYQQQAALANYCRTGKYTSLDGVNDQHVTQYRRLVFNVIQDMLQTAYPLTYSFLPREDWNDLVKDFFAHHACSSPQIWYMPKEFHQYLSANDHLPVTKKYPFLLELIWFEWLETEVFMMEDKVTDYSITGDIQHSPLVINPEIRLEHFTYPVHIKHAGEITHNDKSHYFLSVHRHPESGEVLFTNLSAALMRGLELLCNKPLTATALIETICSEMKVRVTSEIKTIFSHFIAQAIKTRLIIGFHLFDGSFQQL